MVSHRGIRRCSVPVVLLCFAIVMFGSNIGNLYALPCCWHCDAEYDQCLAGCADCATIGEDVCAECEEQCLDQYEQCLIPPCTRECSYGGDWCQWTTTYWDWWVYDWIWYHYERWTVDGYCTLTGGSFHFEKLKITP
jgi:hypothetical protein